ncbi:MAG: ATP-binding cassette domain-containing protein, partial [Kiritimatiellae bacterium]|nr:ATP-binding cassette domain-containing protein [Kiritimatiellia bacterium]
MSRIELTNVTKRWGQFYAVDNLSLVIEDNAFVTLLGPSGCGKTTTLRMIAGLETPTSGKITIDGVTVFDSAKGINISANKRKVGFLFQNYALWPNMTVYQNISFGLTNIKEEMDEIDFEARTAARMIEILEKPQDVVRVLNECVDKKQKLNAQKALLRLIDLFEISQYTAKALLAMKLHEASDLSAAAKAEIEKLNGKINAEKEKHRRNGCELSKDFTVMKGGSPVRSVRKMTAEEIDLIVRRVSRIVKIGMFMDRYPSDLSGGQQQRVAIARTLAPNPKVLFMDEPLSNLDAKLRLEMRSELQRLHLETGSTFVYVTHDQMEAMTLATRICLMDNGVLQQYDEPLTVYNKPNNLFVADFVGNPAINFIDAKGLQQKDGTLALSILDGVKAAFFPASSVSIDSWFEAAQKAAQQAVDTHTVEKANKDVLFKHHIAKVNESEFEDEIELTHEDFVIGVRPEFLRIHEGGALEGEIFSAMPTGMETTVKVRVGEYLLTGVVFGGVTYKLGQRVRLDFSGDGVLLFSRENGML